MSNARRTHSPEFKRRVVERFLAGERIGDLSRELGLARQLLYKWKYAFCRGDPPRARGRPRKSDAVLAPATGSEFEQARRRVEELERKVGQQALEIDFFKGALQRIEASDRADKAPGATASSPRSRR